MRIALVSEVVRTGPPYSILIDLLPNPKGLGLCKKYPEPNKIRRAIHTERGKR